MRHLVSMFYALLFVVVLSFCPVLAQTPTVQFLDTGTQDRITGLYVSETGTIYGVNNQGVVMHSNDGGQTWDYSQTYPGMPLNDITGWTNYETGNTDLLAVGNDGNYWRADDSNNDWKQMDFSSSEDMNDVFSTPDPNTFGNQYVWAVGDHSTVFFSNDGGDSWQQQSTTYQYDDFLGVWFSDAKNGVIGGNNGILYNTDDSGKKWWLMARLWTNRFVSSN